MFYACDATAYAPKILSVVFAEGSVCESIGYRAFYYHQNFKGMMKILQGMFGMMEKGGETINEKQFSNI